MCFHVSERPRTPIFTCFYVSERPEDIESYVFLRAGGAREAPGRPKRPEEAPGSPKSTRGSPQGSFWDLFWESCLVDFRSKT